MFTWPGRGKCVPDLDQLSATHRGERQAAIGDAADGVRVGCGSGVPVSAHHSFAMFDTTKRVTLAGTVTTFEWTNPHAYIEIDVPIAAGRRQALEHRARQPEHPDAERLEVQRPEDERQDHRVISPLKSGQLGGLLSRITMPDGRVLGNGPRGPPEPAVSRGFVWSCCCALSAVPCSAVELAAGANVAASKHHWCVGAVPWRTWRRSETRAAARNSARAEAANTPSRTKPAEQPRPRPPRRASRWPTAASRACRTACRQ